MKNLKRIIAGSVALISLGGVAFINLLRKNKKLSAGIAIPIMVILGILGLTSTYTTVTNELPTFAASTISFDSSSQGVLGGGGTSKTFSHTVASSTERILLVGSLVGTGDTTTGVTYNGENLILIASSTTGSSVLDEFSLWYIVAPATGTNDVVITKAISDISYIWGGSASYTGVDQTSPINTFNTNSASATTTLTTSITTDVDNTWLTGYVSFGPNTDSTVGDNTVLREDINASDNAWSNYIDSGSAQTPAGTHSMTISRDDSGIIGMVIAALNPANFESNTLTVTTQAVTNIATSSATYNGNITDDGTASSTHRGFVWDTSTQTAPGDVAPSSSGYASTTSETGTFGTGPFSLNVTDLTASTTYYVRAYASSTEGFAYGDEVIFTSSSTAAGTITLTDIDDRIVYQRGTDNEYDITVSGTYTGSPTSVEARIVNASTSAEVVAWTSVDGTPSGGTFSGTLANVPDGGWYNLQVRFGNDTVITDEGTNDWGVGILVGTYGQSNMAYWFNTTKGTTQTANNRLSYYNPSGWNTPDGDYEVADGAVSFANSLIETLNIPVGMLDFAIPSAGIVSLKSGGASYTALSDGVTAVGGDLEYFLWIQGETDGDNNMAEATYEGHLETLISSVQTDFSRSGETLSFIMGVIGRRTSSVTSDTGWTQVRNATKDVAAADSTVYIGSWNIDIPLVDGIHATPAGYVTVGQRMANTVLYLEGQSTYYEGPTISSYEQIDTQTVDIRILHVNGTDFTPTSSITGFRVLDDGSAETITSATQVDSTKIRLVISGTITGTLSVDYQWGQQPDIAGVVNDNSALALPLVFSTEISEYVPPPTIIYPTIIIK